MEKLIKPLKNEQGYFLILATIMLLALLTIISIAATHTASTEVQIAGNDTLYQRNVYLAEGAALEAIDRLQNDPNPRGAAFC
jgi:Tfp pilus assembly protein PilX